MSQKATDYIWDLEIDIHPVGKKLVLLAIAFIADNDGVARVNIEQIARMARIDDPAEALGYITELVIDGLLVHIILKNASDIIVIPM